jgi:hypothetical protein
LAISRANFIPLSAHRITQFLFTHEHLHLPSAYYNPYSPRHTRANTHFSLRTLMIEQIRKLHTDTQLFFPRSDEHRIYELGRESMINRTEPNSQGTVCFAKLTPDQLHKWQGFLVKAR